MPKSARDHRIPSPTPSPDRRKARLTQGRTARERLSREQLGQVIPKRETDPIATLVQAQQNRVPKLLPIKYSRMATSAFAFFRGAVGIMASDLASQPHSGIPVQLCGDAHLQNLGSFETPDGHIAFDINDFDETIPGPWEWDTKRMATSIALAASDAGFSGSATRQSIESFLEAYCVAMQQAASQPVLVAARRQIHRMKESTAIRSAFQQARRSTPLELLAKYTEQTRQGHRIFKTLPDSPPRTLWRVAGEEREAVIQAVARYTETLAPDRLHLFRFFTELDVAFKVVGTGSVGLRDYVVLMEGNGPGDPLFLQIKQEVASAYQPYLEAPPIKHQGQRVAEGQRRIQPVSDLLLGWTSIGEHDYLVRQLNDHKGSIDLTDVRPNDLQDLAIAAGHLLARGHARSGDAVVLQGFIGGGSKVIGALLSFATDYADITRKDYKAFCNALENGQLNAGQRKRTTRKSKS